jgi:cytochrome c biogenesis protein CcmG/thiol:disulfide interchange protein DsbE
VSRPWLAVEWRRLLLALPFLIAAGAAAFVLLPRRGPGETPRAALVDTPAGPVRTVGVRKGQLARDFSGQAPNGTAVRLSDLRGKPTIINFWATWCASCLAELPDLKALQQEIGADNLNVLAVNAGEGSAEAARFLKVLDAPGFHIAMDPTLTVADAYGVFGLPESFFIDAAGVIRATYTGQLSKGLMQQYVQAALSGTDGGDPPAKVRLITTVARDHMLEVHALSPDTIEFRSKGLRCDDTYCGAAAIAALERAGGTLRVERYLAEDPPRIVVTLDPSRTDEDRLTAHLADALRGLDDPLYERPLEIVRK